MRKELEKSLAQIEFPKAPPQDIYFLPNANSAEFLMCLGLEEVVKCVQEHLNNKQLKQEKQLEREKQEKTEPTDAPASDSTCVKSSQIEVTYEYPLFCAQCSTDFTPVWRQDKNGVKLCEKCLKSIEKKQIKAEHNARLKQAFLKAVKDKEVFEKQIQAEQEQKFLQQQEAQKLQQSQMLQQQQLQQQQQPPIRQQPRQSIGNSPNVNNTSMITNAANLSNNLQRMFCFFFFFEIGEKKFVKFSFIELNSFLRVRGICKSDIAPSPSKKVMRILQYRKLSNKLFRRSKYRLFFAN